jgi:hypothetical protein
MGARAWVWRLLVVPVAGLLLVAGCSSGGSRGQPAASRVQAQPPAPAALPPGTAPGTAAPQGPLLGVFSTAADGSASELARLDPASLRPLPGPRFRFARASSWSAWSLSPDGSIGIFGQDNGQDNRSTVVVVDLRHLRQLGPAWTQEVSWAAAASWVGRSLVLLAGSVGDATTTTVELLDPLAGRVLRRQTVAAELVAATPLPQGLALLLAPPDAIGTAQLAVVDAAMTSALPIRIRSVALPGIAAGLQRPSQDGSAVGQQALPGLAIDPAGGRVFVVAGRAPVAEVDLATLRVRLHRLSQPASLWQRLAGWLVVPAEAKEQNGPTRQARWLGDGLLAVWGSNQTASQRAGQLQAGSQPSGLELIDTRTWTTRMVDPQVSGAVLAGGRLLAWGQTWQSQPGTNTTTTRSYGLTVFGPGDRRPLHLLGSRQVDWVQAYGDYAYVDGIQDANSSQNRYAVVNLRSGRVLHQANGWLPQLLVEGCCNQ